MQLVFETYFRLEEPVVKTFTVICVQGSFL